CRTGESAASRMRVWVGGLEGKGPDRVAGLQPVDLRLRRLDEADVLGDGDRLAPAGDAELPVDGDRLGLDRVPRDGERRRSRRSAAGVSPELPPAWASGIAATSSSSCATASPRTPRSGRTARI